LGHIAYVFDADNVAFVGDALFALGCGRLFEGTPQQMWASLQKLAALPDDATLYCAHEYTQSNARFAHHHRSDERALQARIAEIDKLARRRQTHRADDAAHRKSNQPVPARAAIANGRAKIRCCRTLRQWIGKRSRTSASTQGQFQRLTKKPPLRRRSICERDNLAYCSGPWTWPITTLRMALDEGRPA
jgi:hypothetical protein